MSIYYCDLLNSRDLLSAALFALLITDASWALCCFGMSGITSSSVAWIWLRRGRGSIWILDFFSTSVSLKFRRQLKMYSRYFPSVLTT